MLCKKCNSQNPENNRFCTKCGFPLSEPVFTQYNYVPQASAKQRSKYFKLTFVFMGIAIAMSVFLAGALLRSVSLQRKNSEYLEIISDQYERIGLLERDVSARDNEISDLESQLYASIIERSALSEKQEYSEELLAVIASEKSWGYASENFHADKGIMVIDRFGGIQELKFFSTYYTTFSLENSNPNVVIAKWSDDEWVTKETSINITPVSSGYATLTFTNELYDNSFKVLIIVK